MRHLTPFMILTGVAVLVACASKPPSRATATGISRATVPAAARAARPKQVRSAFAGYQRVVVKGQALYCRYEVVTGSNIKQQTCLTRSQLVAEQRAAQKFVQQAQQYSSTCAAGGGLVPGGGDSCQP
ncbi:MAG: hypothetical protein ACRETQ_10480 [Gammaproteobacteria bacterium]